MLGIWTVGVESSGGAEAGGGEDGRHEGGVEERIREWTDGRSLSSRGSRE